MANGSQIGSKKDSLATVVQMLERLKPQMKSALPRHLSPDRMVRLVTTTLRLSPKLLECTEMSLAGAIIQACQLGLEPDGFLGEYYLTPRRLHGIWNVVGIPGYRGLMKLARQSGEVEWIMPHPVYRGDEFDYKYGDKPFLEHKEGLGAHDEAAIIYFYAVGRLKSGGSPFWVMSRPDVDRVRERYAAAGDAGPWVTHYPEMGMKTVIRRLCKFLPQSPQLGRAVALDEAAEAGLPQGLDALVDPDGLGIHHATPSTALSKITETLKETQEQRQSPSPAEEPPAAPAAAVGSEGPTDSHAPAWSTPPPAAEVPVAAPAPPESPAKPLPKPRAKKKSEGKFPTVVEQPVTPPEPEPASAPETVTALNLFDLIGHAATVEALDMVTEQIYSSGVFQRSAETQKGVIRQSLIKRRRELTA